MPTYDYVCRECGHEFEEFQSMSAKQLKKCPSCGAMKLERLIGTGAGVIFKGGGFYETDYRSESYKKGAEADKKPSEGGDKATTGGAGSCGCGKPAGGCGAHGATPSVSAEKKSKKKKDSD